MSTTCQTCGGSVPADATECPTCGAAAPQPPASPTASGGADDPAGAPPTLPPPPPPPPPGRAGARPATPTDSRNWAMGAHLSAFLGLMGGVLIFLGPLVVWLLKRDGDPFVREHAVEALNFNLTMFGAGILAVIVAMATLGIGLLVVLPLGLVLFVVWVVFTLVAAVRASNGDRYRYPVSIRLVS